jgi:hypothetical protein
MNTRDDMIIAGSERGFKEENSTGKCGTRYFVARCAAKDDQSDNTTLRYLHHDEHDVGS